jgi:hypothetical protein
LRTWWVSFFLYDFPEFCDQKKEWKKENRVFWWVCVVFLFLLLKVAAFFIILQAFFECLIDKQNPSKREREKGWGEREREKGGGREGERERA